MKSKRWWWISLAYAAAILFVSVIPVPEGPKGIPVDKWVHVCEYLLLAWLLWQASYLSGFSFLKTAAVSILLPAVYGALIECIQYFIPYRSADVMDALANSIGALIGYAAAFFIRIKK